MKSYNLQIAGLTRKLPLCAVNEKLDIAAFIILGDVELTIAVAKELLCKVDDFDVIVTPEAKSIPLAYEMARQCGKPYVVARKSNKLYMQNSICVSVKSITTKNEQTLYLAEAEIGVLCGKKVLIVDDVISTGESLIAVEKLVEKAGGIVSQSCAVLAEGDASKRSDIVFLAPLPLFFKE